MKIKRKVQKNLPQLIEWGFKNDVTGAMFSDDRVEAKRIRFEVGILVSIHGDIHKGDTFTVEVEETLTKDTVFPSLTVVRKQYFASGNSTVNVTKINNKSINALIGKQPLNSTFEYKEVYLMDEDKLGQCIWRDGKLVE